MHPFVSYLQTIVSPTETPPAGSGEALPEHAQRLPGAAAQRRLAPRFAHGEVRSFTSPATARRSAVLAILCMSNGELSLVLTLRSQHLPSHKGQFSFPGGRMEEGESVVQAALRETEEELGLDISQLRVLGHLTNLYTPPSNSSIYPVVAWCDQLPPTAHSPHEVEEVHVVALRDLRFDRLVEEEWELRGERMTVPFWRLEHSTPLWGATAIIISELMSIYEDWLSGRS